MDNSEKPHRLLRYTGNPSQIFYAQRLRLSEGKADGIDAIDVDNGGGIRLLVLPGRGMDIGRLQWRGINLSYLSKGGFAHSAHYDAAGMEGLKTFAGGFLSTCGLRNSGLPNHCEGEDFGFHGRIGQTPAEEVGISRDLDAPRPSITLTGKVREGCLFGSALELFRTIRIYFEEPIIEIEDNIHNYSAKDESILLLYHFNLGYPLLDENSEFLTSHVFDSPVNAIAAAGMEKRYIFAVPAAGEPEQCFYYRQKRGTDGDAFAACINPNKGIGVAVHTNPDQLPLLCNWQSWAAGDYVMGIEPCTVYGDGRAAHMERNQLQVIPAYQVKRVNICIELADAAGIVALRAKSKGFDPD